MNSSAGNDSSFRQWRSKRERDPSEGRTRKRLITREKISQRLNEKENKQQPIGPTMAGDKEHRCEPGNGGSCLVDLNLNKSKSSEVSTNSDLPENKSDLIIQLHVDPMETPAAPSNQTLKQKLVSLNNSKFGVVIEEDVESEELASAILNDEFDDSEYDYDGEDLSENDENYYANDYPDDREYKDLDFYRYREYENEDEREMLEKFEKSWANDGSDHYSDEEDY